MNAIDVYDFDDAVVPAAKASSSTADGSSSGDASSSTTAAANQPSLNEEVQQALGTLGGWWGGFRKQSAVALASARKDLGSVVQQAQKEYTKLTVASPPTSPRPAATETETSGEEPSTAQADPSPAPDDANPEADDAATSATPRASLSSTATGLFSQLTNASTSLQRSIASNADLQSLRTNLSSNLTSLQASVQPTLQSISSTVQPHVQNLSSSVQSLPSTLPANVNANFGKVEGFVMEKGEEFWKGAGEFFREAVKVVPPSEEELRERERLGFGGLEMGMGGVLGVGGGSVAWAFDDLGGDDAEVVDAAPGSKGKSPVGADVAVSRTAGLLKQLRTNPALLKVDPAGADEKGKDAFEWFVGTLEEKGVLVGSEAWDAKCAKEEELFEELRGTKAALVPEELDEVTFWKRYWFRAWQIREAEEKRKALLQATAASTQKEEDFSWEEDEEDETAPTPTKSVTGPRAGGHGKGPSTSSPRESEDSYDLVSTRSGNASGTALASTVTLAAVPEEKRKEAAQDEDGQESTVKIAKRMDEAADQEAKDGDDSSGDSDWE